MKLVIIGGSGLIGSKLVARLRQNGHEVIAASPHSGVDILTGDGLAEAMAGAEVVVDVSNSPSFDGPAAMSFFETAGRNLTREEIAAGVRHHVALSVVGTERMVESGYFQAKLEQEERIAGGKIPYTIVRSTQFFEFAGRIADSAKDGDKTCLPPVLFQPIAADDVASLLADIAQGEPLNGMVEIAGPERSRLDEWVGRYLTATNDPRKVTTDKSAPYFGIQVDDASLVPGATPRLGSVTFAEWLGRPRQRPEAKRQASAAVRR